MYVSGEKEAKKQKKIWKAMRNAGYAIGIGIGLVVVKFLVPGSGGAETTRRIMDGIGLWLIGYGVLLVLFWLFKRDWTPRVNMLMMYIVMPAVILKLVMDAL